MSWMGLGDFFVSPFNQPNYDVTQGLPGYTAGSNLQGLNQAQTGSQNAMAQQQQFLSALGAGGLNQNQANVFNQQQALSRQLQGQAQGRGPNPAQSMLAQNTGQNIQQQAALMGSARGAQSNPGLVTRQAGQVGGNIQQQAVGQAATMRAQQQLSAQQQLAAQQGQMANLATAGVGQQQTGLSQLGQQNLAYQQMLQNALTAQNQQQIQAQLGQGQIQGNLAAIGKQNQAGAVGGILNGLGGMLSLARGGVVQNFDGGGAVQLGPAQGAFVGAAQSQTPTSIEEQTAANQPKSLLGQSESGKTADDLIPFQPTQSGSNAIYQGMSNISNNLFGKGMKDQIKGMMSGGSGSGGNGGQGAGLLMALLSSGGAVQGKAKVSGDSKTNDTVPAMLSPGEIVIPRSHAGDPDKIASFLNGLLGTNLKNASKKVE